MGDSYGLTRADLVARHPSLLQFINKHRTGNSFLDSLKRQLDDRKYLSHKQISVAKTIQEQVEQPTFEFSLKKERGQYFFGIIKVFKEAARHMVYPKMYLTTLEGQKIRLQRAGVQSTLPGSINITDGKQYGDNRFFGRLNPSGELIMRPIMTLDILNLLIEVDKDPDKTLRIQGQRIGICCLCGRTLTNKESIKLGIGPICRGKWGM